MKFLFFTDPHIRTISPRYRKDNFYETILKKLEWVRETGEKHDVEAYICGGDWLDRPDIPYATLSGLAEVLSKFNKKIYTVLGNHDIYGYNPSTHIRTALSVLRASGLIHRLSQDPIILENGGVKVGISGVDAHYFLDRNGRISDYTDVKIVPGATRIHVVHGFLAKKAWPEIPMTEINSVINTNADILLTGHDHSGFGVHAENNRLICNPGALGRLSASAGDVNLRVGVAIIEVTENGKEITIEYAPKHIAPFADEVLDRDAMLEDKKQKEIVTNFSNIAKSVTRRDGEENIKVTDFFSSLERSISDSSISDEVAKIIRAKIAEAEEELKKEA